MKMTIYWTKQHSRRDVHEFRFRAACCWLSQEVEFLGWRLRLETLCPPCHPILCRHRTDKEVSMPCTRCNGVCVNDQFYDRVDEQG
jgi:hypothetical protein